MPRRPRVARRSSTNNVQTKKYIGPIAVVGLILVATIIELRLQGRLWACSSPKFLLTAKARSSKTSQRSREPYSLPHVAHGLMFAGLLVLVFPKVPPVWRFVIAIGLESAWEVIENTNTVIERYRVATAALG